MLCFVFCFQILSCLLWILPFGCFNNIPPLAGPKKKKKKIENYCLEYSAITTTCQNMCGNLYQRIICCKWTLHRHTHTHTSKKAEQESYPQCTDVKYASHGHTHKKLKNLDWGIF
ncbi:hypothetical protein HanRHA438_Chr09g0379611 [Helianthus annuus]|nr:hypothetical protein HanRHA438_Chr09g0379611 [Helianthus annuus]